MPFSTLLLAGQGSAMISLFSGLYLAIFLPVVLLIYGIMPKNGKKYVLLAAGYVFFWLISGGLILYLLFSTLSMHYFGLWLERVQERGIAAVSGENDRENRKAIRAEYAVKQKRIVLFAVCLHIGALLLLKYAGFFVQNLDRMLTVFHSSLQIVPPTYLLPIGISFFTLQALSYILDVYHGVIRADENLPRLALFLGFFPAIIEGPICRYSQTADKLWDAGPIRYENLTLGLQRILYGMMKKMLVADRLNAFVKQVFTNYPEYDGGIIAMAAVGYTIQLYMDFSGSMDAVAGTAQIFGIEMPENFKRPFFSATISEFWKRWHISLGAWLKDYIFYPVSTSAVMKRLTKFGRKHFGNHYGPLLAGSVALFCVWILNGLWHGPAWHYIFFGMYHFTWILCGNLLEPLVLRINGALGINPQHFLYRGMQILRTAALVVIGELFFRAETLRGGLQMFKVMITQFSVPTLEKLERLNAGIDRCDFMVVGIVLLIVLSISILNERGVFLRQILAEQNVLIRWAVLDAAILSIVIFGAYGSGYAPVDPMYAKF
ncbi:MAG: MBOAT family protein [Clostridium sp.]|nr:MBOAT family protein [Clostridium sp.]